MNAIRIRGLIITGGLLTALIITPFATVQAENQRFDHDWEKRFATEYYSEHLFHDIDLDQDSFLSIIELERHKFWKKLLATGEFFPTCDHNHDYRLSLHEIRTYFHLKQIQRTRQEIRLYSSLKNKLGKRLWNVTWIANHPNFAKQLVNSRYYLCRHPRTAKTLVENTLFKKRYPVLHAKLVEHKNWVQDHPLLALNIGKITEEMLNHASALDQRLGVNKWGKLSTTTAIEQPLEVNGQNKLQQE